MADELETSAKKADELAELLAEAFEQTVYRLMHLERRLNKSVPFTLPQLRILFTLSFNKSPLPMSEISSRIGVTMGTLTEVSKRLIALGLVSRERSEDDDRIVILSLKDKGKKIIKEIQERRRKFFSEFCNSLDPDDCINLLKSHLYILEGYRNILQPKKDK